MKSKILLFILVQVLFFNLKPVTIFAQWYQQYDPSSCALEDVSFINQYTGWACGECGQILKTTNGGLYWFLQNSGLSEILTGIHAVDSQYVYCVGWYETILKSTNGGNNWIILRNMVTQSPSFFKTFFLNKNKGWLLKNNYILRTSDGGISFDSTHVIFSYIRDIYFKDSLNGILCGDGSLIMKSTNSGINWNQIQIPLSYYAPNFFRESFIGNYGWVVGGTEDNLGGICWRTTNFGITWDSISRIPYPINNDNYCVFFTNLNTGWCGGTYGYIFKTTNSGLNWYHQYVPIDGFRGDFWFHDDSTGWVVGGGGYILHTSNGGTYVSVKPISNKISEEFNLYQNYPNPFNSKTIISYELPITNSVKLIIYNVLGEEVIKIVDDKQNAGKYKIEFDASNFSSGTYFYTLITNNFRITKKMNLIK